MRAKRSVTDQTSRFRFVDWVKQLARDAGSTVFFSRVLVRRTILTGRVAFRRFFLDEPIHDSFTLFVADWCLRFSSALQRRTATTKREVNDLAAVLLFNARLINFVRGALSKIERHLLHRNRFLSGWLK